MLCEEKRTFIDVLQPKKIDKKRKLASSHSYQLSHYSLIILIFVFATCLIQVRADYLDKKSIVVEPTDGTNHFYYEDLMSLDDNEHLIDVILELSLMDKGKLIEKMLEDKIEAARCYDECYQCFCASDWAWGSNHKNWNEADWLDEEDDCNFDECAKCEEWHWECNDDNDPDGDGDDCNNPDGCPSRPDRGNENINKNHNINENKNHQGQNQSQTQNQGQSQSLETLANFNNDPTQTTNNSQTQNANNNNNQTQANQQTQTNNQTDSSESIVQFNQTIIFGSANETTGDPASINITVTTQTNTSANSHTSIQEVINNSSCICQPVISISSLGDISVMTEMFICRQLCYQEYQFCTSYAGMICMTDCTNSNAAAPVCLQCMQTALLSCNDILNTCLKECKDDFRHHQRSAEHDILESSSA